MKGIVIISIYALRKPKNREVGNFYNVAHTLYC